MDELIRTFIADADDCLASMEQALLLLESDPHDSELLNEVFRAVHTIKGNASCFNFTELTAFTHELEELLDRARSGETELVQSHFTQFLAAVDTIREMVDAAVGRRPSKATLTLRVGITKIDRLLDLTGELAIARGHVQQAVDESGANEKVLDALRELDRLAFELQEGVMNLRMVPVGPALRDFHRIVRDLGSAKGKRVDFTIDGEDVEIDLTVIELLKDPFTHMVRNAIDHGLETPEVREACGKSAAGQIRVTASHAAGGVVIKIGDDGAGIDESKLAERARQLGLEPDLNLIFEPGFSTAENVTDLSGRGVGMDVVRRNVESLGGTIAIDTTQGLGTTFTIRLPLTVAVISGFGVGVGDETYILPIDVIGECVELPAGTGSDDTTVINLRGEPLPCVRVRSLFAIEHGTPERESVVVVQHESMRAGIVVDKLLGSAQSVMKPMARMFRDVPGIAGSSILGNGRVALILDVPQILERVRRQ